MNGVNVCLGVFVGAGVGVADSEANEVPQKGQNFALTDGICFPQL
jgi:hypothetical protein